MKKHKKKSRSSHSRYTSPNESINQGDHYQPPPRRTIRPREVKVFFPQFFGKDDVESYLDWEMKVEQLFPCHKVSEERKVPLATLSFQGHAMYWWTALERKRRLHNDPPIRYWNDLKSAMRRRHIPTYYGRELMNKLQRLQQRIGKVTSHTSSRTSDIKCFKCLGRGHIASQCPTKKVMIMMGHDIYSSQDEAITFSSNSEEEASDEEENVESTFPYEGELLMIRRLLNNQPSGTLSQRENIFNTRCKVLNNACSLIVDSGSWCNYCSTRLVEKLDLTSSPQPKPYQLHWLNEDGDLVVDQLVKVKLSIGNYEDVVLCDVVPMEACHILLGRPWQFDKKTMHIDLTNEITFTHREKKFVLHPLSPQQVVEDQAQMKLKRESEKRLKKKKKREKKSL
uniref:CCHC-type domain-containing protein n=1 Tax=Cajanus cajan TaxID=3821 RepID=A0A151UGX0_CAJCA